MSKRQRLLTMLAVTVLFAGVLTATLVWGVGLSQVSAAPTSVEAHKSVSAQEVAPGQTLEYTIVVTNTSGVALGGLSVVDSLHGDLVFVEGTSTVEPLGSGLLTGDQNGILTFTLLSMVSDKVVTITFDAELSTSATPGSTIANAAQIYSDTVEIFETDVVTFTVSPTPDLQIYSPNGGTIVTQRPGEVLEVSGRAWAQADPVPFPQAPVMSPIAYVAGTTDFQVDWSDSVGAFRYVWYESVDPDFGVISDSGTVLVSEGSSTFITGKTPGTYYYRVRAYASDPTRFSRYSNVEGVTVTAAGTLRAAPRVSPASVSLDVTNNALISVEVSVDDGGTWHAASLTANPDGWWDWTYDWTLPEGDGEKVSIMARAAYATGGDYSQDVITVTLKNSGSIIYMPIIAKRWPPVPYAPVLNEINPSGSDFTVSWTYSSQSAGVPNPYEYQLQQASDAGFTQNVENYTVVGTSRAFTSMSGGTYHYRVRGRNSYGYGEWSNVRSVQLGRAYDFNSGRQGWEVARSDEDDGYQQTPRAAWRDGALYHLIWGSRDSSILSPMEAGPAAPYTIRARMALVVDETLNNQFYTAKSEMTFGIIFGGNSGTPCPALRISGGCLSHYYRVLATYNVAQGRWDWSLKRVDYHDADGAGRSDGDNSNLLDWRPISGFNYDPRGWNEWKIEVTNETTRNIRVYLNGHLIGEATDHRYINDRYFGTFTASPAHGAVATKWDWFEVK